MAMDVREAGSPEWWLKRLETRLAERRIHFEALDKYYRNEANVPVSATKTVREAYRRLMALARTNFAELVVEAPRERMLVTGFRTGAGIDENGNRVDELGDKEAWRIWQANALDADAALVHRASLSMGMGYVMVGGIDDEIGAPLITPEDPREVIAEADPRRRRRSLAALKILPDPIDNVEWAVLLLPGVVHYAVRPKLSADRGNIGWDNRWEWGAAPAALPAPVVPVVAFPNKANIFGTPSGEYEAHLSILNRINYTILSRLEIATLQAFRQRAVKGLPLTDAEGNDIDYSDIFSMDPGALWQLPDTAEMWESGQVDLGPIRQAIRDDVQDLAAVTRTPLFYLTPDAANGSAEGASLAREGLVFKTNDRIVQASESWEQVMAFAFLFAGDEQRARRPDLEALWAPPERFSLAERYDAASKAQAAGVPWRAVMRDVLQFSPQQVDRMESERASDALLAPTPIVQAAGG